MTLVTRLPLHGVAGLVHKCPLLSWGPTPAIEARLHRDASVHPRIRGRAVRLPAARHRRVPLWVPDWWASTATSSSSPRRSVAILALYLRAAPSPRGNGREYVSFMVLLAPLRGVRRHPPHGRPRGDAAHNTASSASARCWRRSSAPRALDAPDPSLLQTNRERRRVKHTVDLLHLPVSNVGGMLTPLGDPPLFLGYLSGVPFAGPFGSGRSGSSCHVLLVVYFVWDTRQYAHESMAARGAIAANQPLRLPAASTCSAATDRARLALLRAPCADRDRGGAGVSLWQTRRPSAANGSPPIR